MNENPVWFSRPWRVGGEGCLETRLQNGVKVGLVERYGFLDCVLRTLCLSLKQLCFALQEDLPI